MTEPTDAELDALRQADNGALNFVTLRQFRAIARAVLAAKWGTPPAPALVPCGFCELAGIPACKPDSEHEAERECGQNNPAITTQAQAEKCAVCGDGNARLLVMRSCDVCGSDYAGQSESEVNVVLTRAREATQAQAGAVPLTDEQLLILRFATSSLFHLFERWNNKEIPHYQLMDEMGQVVEHVIRRTVAAHGIKGGQHGDE